MAMVSIKKDLFGKSDATRNLCSKHAPRYSMVSSQANEKAVGGSDVCHTCEAHVVAILDLEKERDALAAELSALKRTREQEQDYADTCYRNRQLEAALLAWYDESGRGAKQSTWPANLWALAREIGERATSETKGE